MVAVPSVAMIAGTPSHATITPLISAQRGPGQDGQGERRQRVNAGAKQRADHVAADAQGRADREIDLPRHDDRGHAGRNRDRDRRRSQDRPEAVVAPEIVRRQAEHDDDERKRDDGSKLARVASGFREFDNSAQGRGRSLIRERQIGVADGFREIRGQGCSRGAPLARAPGHEPPAARSAFPSPPA